MPDATYQIPDVTTPSETLKSPPTFLDTWDTDLYLLLQDGLRTIDEVQGTGILKRFLKRPTELKDRFQQKFWRATLLQDFVKTPDDFVRRILLLLGFGRGSGLPEEIANKLTIANKRKLASLAFPYWMARGRRTALDASIRFVTGLRPAIDSWFDLRAILGEIFLGGEGSEADPWLLWSTRIARDLEPGGLADTQDFAEHHVVLRIPGIVGSTGAEARTLVEDLCELARPMGERYELVFVDFLDLFLDGMLSHWTVPSGAVTPTWSAPVATADVLVTAPKLAGLKFAGGAKTRFAFQDATTWKNYDLSFFLSFGASWAGIVEVRFYVTDPPVGGIVDPNLVVALAVRFDQPSGVFRIGKVKVGTPFEEQASKLLTFAAAGTTRSFRIEVQNHAADAQTHVRIVYEGDVFLDAQFANDGRSSGPVEFIDQAFGVPMWELHRVEIVRPLPTVVLLKP